MIFSNLSLLVFLLYSLMIICPISSEAYKAKATWYNTGLGACGEVNKDTDLVVALPAQFANSNCFRTVTLTNAARPIGPKVVAKVVDKCMGCNGMDLDLSPAAFKALNVGDLNTGKIFIEWVSKIRMTTLEVESQSQYLKKGIRSRGILIKARGSIRATEGKDATVYVCVLGKLHEHVR